MKIRHQIVLITASTLSVVACLSVAYWWQVLNPISLRVAKLEQEVMRLEEHKSHLTLVRPDALVPKAKAPFTHADALEWLLEKSAQSGIKNFELESQDQFEDNNVNEMVFQGTSDYGSFRQFLGLIEESEGVSLKSFVLVRNASTLDLRGQVAW